MVSVNTMGTRVEKMRMNMASRYISPGKLLFLLLAVLASLPGHAQQYDLLIKNGM